MAHPIHNWPISGFPGDSIAFYFQSGAHACTTQSIMRHATTVMSARAEILFWPYAQSVEVYRRQDGTFLHGARTPGPAGCDNYDGSQLWKSVDTQGKAWGCISQAAGGLCAGAGVPFHGRRIPCEWTHGYVDHCANLSSAPFLLPGSMYTHFLRLADGRLLMTWTKRSPTFDDDGFGSGTRGLLSYDDGLTWDTTSDYIVVQAQDDTIHAGCRAGCGCTVSRRHESRVTRTIKHKYRTVLQFSNYTGFS